MFSVFLILPRLGLKTRIFYRHSVRYKIRPFIESQLVRQSLPRLIRKLKIFQFKEKLEELSASLGSKWELKLEPSCNAELLIPDRNIEIMRDQVFRGVVIVWRRRRRRRGFRSRAFLAVVFSQMIAKVRMISTITVDR